MKFIQRSEVRRNMFVDVGDAPAWHVEGSPGNNPGGRQGRSRTKDPSSYCPELPYIRMDMVNGNHCCCRKWEAWLLMTRCGCKGGDIADFGADQGS